MENIKSGLSIILKNIDEANRVLEFIGSNELMDRDGEIVSPEGWDLINYKKNPVILFGHKYDQPAVAKAENVWVEGKNLMFRVKFPEPGTYELSDVLYKLYKGKFMAATSVGFIPKEWKDGTGEKGQPVRTYLKQELLELSLVPVPANPSAILASKFLKDAWMAKSIDQKEMDLFCKKVKELFKKEENTQEVKEDKYFQLEKQIHGMKEEIGKIISEFNNLKFFVEEKLKEKTIHDLILSESGSSNLEDASLQEILDGIKQIAQESKKGS